MNKLSQTFETLIKEGYTLTKGITDVKDKTMALAALAQAIAATGLVELNDGTDGTDVADTTAKKTETKKTETKSNTKKDSLKADAGKGAKTATPVKEEKEEIPAPIEEIAPAEETTPVEDTTPVDNGEVEVEEEWTDAMCELKAESLERLNAYVAAWTEDYVYNQCVPAFFEDQTIVGGDNIRPTNIDGFVTYLDTIAAQA